MQKQKITPTTQVPVIIEVLQGKVTCSPDPVVIYKDEEVEWVFNAGGHVIDFESDRPFGMKRIHSNGKPTSRSGPHSCETIERFKYTIIVPGCPPLDPVVEADPRKRPPRG